MPLNIFKRQENNWVENAIIKLPNEVLLLLGGAGIGLSGQAFIDVSRGAAVSNVIIWLASISLVFLIYYWKKYKVEQAEKIQERLTQEKNNYELRETLNGLKSSIDELVKELRR